MKTNEKSRSLSLKLDEEFGAIVEEPAIVGLSTKLALSTHP